MYIRQKKFTNPVSHEIDEMQAHLVLADKTVGSNSCHGAIIRDADKQCPPARIKEGGNCFQSSNLHFVVLLPGMKVNSQC